MSFLWDCKAVYKVLIVNYSKRHYLLRPFHRLIQLRLVKTHWMVAPNRQLRLSQHVVEIPSLVSLKLASYVKYGLPMLKD